MSEVKSVVDGVIMQETLDRKQLKIQNCHSWLLGQVMKDDHLNSSLTFVEKIFVGSYPPTHPPPVLAYVQEVTIFCLQNRSERD